MVCLYQFIGTGADTLNGTWCKNLLDTIMENTPHSWTNHTLQCFPAGLSEFFQQKNIVKENKQQIKVILTIIYYRVNK